jgi:hypothetical protein
MFHVEMRQFPHSAWAFNLSEDELLQFLVPWSHEQWIELGERKWNPHQARMTVLEGPHLPVGELSMGRGWRNAQRSSQDVTERVLAQTRALHGAATTVEGVSAPSPSTAPGAPPATRTPSIGAAPTATGIATAAAAAAGAAHPDAGADLQSLLGADPPALLQAWRLAAQRRPELTPSESLALAERTLRALDS